MRDKPLSEMNDAELDEAAWGLVEEAEGIARDMRASLLSRKGQEYKGSRRPKTNSANGTRSLTKMVHANPQGHVSSAKQSGQKVYHTANGDVYELSPEAKVAEALPGKKQPEISLDRWLAASMLGDQCEDKGALDYVRDTKQLSGGTSGILIPDGFQGEWIDNIRSNMVLQAAGMTTVTMNHRTETAARVLSDPPVAWRAEGGALAAGDPTFELRQLVAQSLAVRVQATAELAQDSPDFGAQLLDIMGRALAHEIDRVGLMGSGAGNEPTGIYNTTGIQTVPAVGTPTNYSAFVSGLQKLLETNVDLALAERNAIMSPRTWGTLEGLVATDNQPMQRPRSLDRMTFRPTTSIPDNLGVGTNESVVILGDFSNLVLGVRLEAQVEALRLQTFADNLVLEFVGWTRVDFLARRPASFVLLSGVTA